MPSQFTWLGHSCWLIETGGQRLLVDPFLDDNPAAATKAEAVSADFILVTHGHFDHVSDAAKIAARTGAKVIANYEICEWLQKKGAPQIDPMNTGGSIAQPFGRVKLTPAWHSSTMPDGASGGAPNGFVLELEDARVYIAGDTALFSDMKLIGANPLDLALLPIGDRFTMGPEDSLLAIDFLQPRFVAPMHFDTWPPIVQDTQAWAQRVQVETNSSPFVLKPGGKFRLEA